MSDFRLQEHALLLGRDQDLVAIVSGPVPHPSTCRHAVVLLNAGFVSRVGPNRVYVDLARELSHRGCLVCRFDFSGLGDSPARQDGHGSFLSRAVQETEEVMDGLSEKYGCREFLLAGICSGADAAFRAAERDSRVVGLALINGTLVDDAQRGEIYEKAKRRAHARLYGRKLLRLKSWVRLLSGQSRVWRLLASVRHRVRRGESEARLERSTETTGNSSQTWSRLRARGVNILLIYSACSAAVDIFQLAVKPHLDLDRHAGAVDVAIFAESDHIFTPMAGRRAFLSRLGDWCTSLCSAALEIDSDLRGGTDRQH